ncbi:MAG: type II secretion system F family protein [Micrococcales bacterium]
MQIDFQLAALVEMLVAILLSGESLFLALKRVAEISSSLVSSEIEIMLKRVELGGELTVELSALCERLPTESMREFSNKLSLAMGRGTPLASSLSALAMSIRAARASKLLRIAGVNETKMLIPVVLLICPVTVIFALYPSSQYLAAGFI